MSQNGSWIAIFQSLAEIVAEVSGMKHNVYFSGAVQSLGFDVATRRGTVGIIEAGEYTFDAGAAERVEIICGTLDVLLPGANWTTVQGGGRYLVPAGATVSVRAGTSVAYVCWFE